MSEIGTHSDNPREKLHTREQERAELIGEEQEGGAIIINFCLVRKLHLDVTRTRTLVRRVTTSHKTLKVPL